MAINIRAGAIREISTDPSNPSVNTNWLQAEGRIGTPGLAMGPMGLTYSSPVVNRYLLKYQTVEGSIVSTELV